MRTSNVVYAFDTDFRALNDDEIDFVSGGDGTPILRITWRAEPSLPRADLASAG